MGSGPEVALLAQSSLPSHTNISRASPRNDYQAVAELPVPTSGKRDYIRQESQVSLQSQLEQTIINRSALEPSPKIFTLKPNEKGNFLRDRAQSDLKKEVYNFPAGRSNSVQPRTDPLLKYNSNIKQTMNDKLAQACKASALRFTNRMLPPLDLESTRGQSAGGFAEKDGPEKAKDKFISSVPLIAPKDPLRDQKKAFTKQKMAHEENMKDTMYRVHLRDQSFMKIQKHLQSVDASVTSHDPQGKFDYTQHLDMVLKMNQ